MAAVILAAGRGTRMNSDVPKALQPLHSRPMLRFVTEVLKRCGVKKQILILGYKAKDIKKIFKGHDYVMQKKLLGSGDAVKRTKGLLARFRGDILVLYGDTPFITAETIRRLVSKHKKEKASSTVLTASVDDPSGYGRILKDETGFLSAIIEDKDALGYEKAIKEINVGCYCFNKKDLFLCLDKLKINAKKREFYLTDVIKMMKGKDKKVISLTCKDNVQAFGVDSKADLARANNIMKKRILELLMSNGVSIVDVDTTFIDKDAKIGKDTVIKPHTIIEKNVTIGKNCEIGPFARIRQGTRLADNVAVGNFVELVRTKVSRGSKIKHMTYLGDAEVGKNVNIGAGTITANYDGKRKNKTVIADGAFIGVGAILIAPVKIGKGALVGAGSVVTRKKNVPPHKTVAGVPARLLK